MALAYLSILFIVMIAISISLVTLLYILKNQKAKNTLFYVLVIWSLLITFLNVTSLPSNYLFQRFFGVILGLLAIIAIFIKLKTPKKTNIAYLLVTASTLLGFLDLFIL